MIPTAITEETEQYLGQVPNWMDDLAPQAAEHSWGSFRDLELSETELDNREKELVGLGAAAAMRCPYCVHFHSEAAKLHGVSDDELIEAVNVAGSTRYFSTILHGSEADHDRFVEETAEIMAYVREQQAAAGDD